MQISVKLLMYWPSNFFGCAMHQHYYYYYFQLYYFKVDNNQQSRQYFKPEMQ